MAPDLRPLILVVEDDAGAAVLQRRHLERAGYRVAIASNFTEAENVLAGGEVKLVLMDYRLGNASGLEVHRRLKAAGFDVPVIMVSGAVTDETVIEAMRAGVRDVVVKDVEYLQYLPEAVREVVKQATSVPEWVQEPASSAVLVVEDDIGVATLQKRRLERAGYSVIIATDAGQAEAIVAEGKVSLLMLDFRLQGNTTGLDVYERLKARGFSTPAILVTAFGDQEVVIRALRAGVRDFVPKSSDYLDQLPSAVDRVIAQARVERKLLESEQRLASIVGTTLDAIAMCDEESRILLFNRSAEAMFECVAQAASQRRLVDFIPELKLTAIAQQVEAVGDRGRRTPIEVSVSDFAIQGKRFFTVIARDISERRRTEEQLREADRRKDEFLGMLAHELRNPVAAIMNASEVLARTASDANVEKLSGIVRRQTTALSRMVDDLLDVSRVTLGKINILKEPLKLQDVVARAADSVRELAQREGLAFEVEMPDVPLDLLGDATRLEQVLMNLLNNAIKFTPPGGRVGLVIQREGDRATVRVSDNGIGMSHSLIPTVFDLFVQGDTSLDRSKSGLGIGLALVKKLVELHGGEVQARSAGPGKGSEFVVRLPLAPAGLDARHSDAGSGEKAESLRVLVVDDQRDIADSITMLLLVCGHSAKAVYDGAEALRVCGAEHPDVMFVDIGMPGMTGYELAEQVRRDPALAGVRLVALTGYGGEHDRAHALAAGFHMHLTKPVTLQVLTTALADMSSPPGR
jgi:signal transduction histidine kinase/DNA-binding LytR/AlgR family response regulator